MQADLIDYLHNSDDLIATVSNSGGVPNIQWVTRPNSSGLPALTLQTVSAVPSYDQSGRDELTSTRVQFDSWADTYAGARSIMDKLKSLLNPSDGFGSVLHGRSSFERFYFESDRDLPVQDLDGGQRVYHIGIDVLIWHRPIPAIP